MGLLSYLPVVGSAIEGVANLFTQGQAQANQWDMMNRQREWALQDWNMQNAYNAPAAQMQRLKAAGLNPNLVYGSGTNAAGTAAPVRSSPSANPQPINVNLVQSMLQGFLSMYDLQKTQAMTDQIKAQTEAIKAKETLDRTKVKDINWNLKFKDDASPFNLGYLQLRNNNLIKYGRNLDDQDLAIIAGTKKTAADTQFTLDQNSRAKLLQGWTIKSIASNILTQAAIRAKTAQEKLYIEQKIQNLKSSKIAQDYQNRLNQSGLSPRDPAYLRLAESFLFDMTENL